MLMRSQHMATISYSLTSARIFSTSFESRPSIAFFAGFKCFRASGFAGEGARATLLLLQPKIIGIRTQLLVPCFRNQKIVLQAQPTSTWPVNAGLDREHHVFSDGASPSLMRVRKFMSTRSHPMTYGMRRLARISAFSDTRADQPIKIGK